MEEEKEIREVRGFDLLSKSSSRQPGGLTFVSRSQLMERTKASRLQHGDQPSDVDMDDPLDAAVDSEEGSAPFAPPPPARGRGRGGRGRGSRGRGRGETT